MERVVFADRLTCEGYTSNEIARRRRIGELERVRRGAYALPSAEPLDPADRHRRLVEATVPQLSADAVVSHASAAVLHRLPVWASDLQTVHLTRPRSGGGGKRRPMVTMHTQPLASAEVCTIDGIVATSLERTIFDLARTVLFERAVAAGDRALTLGMAPDLLVAMLERGRRWHGINQAKRLATFIDGRAESAGESVSRVRCHELRLPVPVPQLPVLLPNGRTVYADLGWEELRTLGEFDGRVKYEKLLRPGERASDVVIREKRREDLLRTAGWQVVRWRWEQLWNFEPVQHELLAAFDRGRRLALIA